MCYIVSVSMKGQLGKVDVVLHLQERVVLKIGLHHGKGILKVAHY